jgi:hypothetical protein
MGSSTFLKAHGFWQCLVNPVRAASYQGAASAAPKMAQKASGFQPLFDVCRPPRSTFRFTKHRLAMPPERQFRIWALAVKFQHAVYIRAKLSKGTDLSVPMIAKPKIRALAPEGR